MRTPGRCTNVEGCWIGATQRDVWLSLGEDFACPNCGNRLEAPPRRAMSVNNLKKVAITSAALVGGIAAIAFGAIKLSAIHWDAQPQIVAARALSRGEAALRASLHAPGQDAVVPPHGPTAPGPARPGELASARPAGRQGAVLARKPEMDSATTDSTAITFVPAAPLLASPASTARNAGAPSGAAPATPAPNGAPPGGTQTTDLAANAASSAILVFAQPKPARAPSSQSAIRGNAMPADGAALAPAPPPPAEDQAAAIVSVVSQASLSPPRAAGRELVLPISFGKPEAPEDAEPPVSLRWRYRGMTRVVRQSYFLPVPAAHRPSLDEICRSAGFEP